MDQQPSDNQNEEPASLETPETSGVQESGKTYKPLLNRLILSRTRLRK